MYHKKFWPISMHLVRQDASFRLPSFGFLYIPIFLPFGFGPLRFPVEGFVGIYTWSSAFFCLWGGAHVYPNLTHHNARLLLADSFQRSNPRVLRPLSHAPTPLPSCPCGVVVMNRWKPLLVPGWTGLWMSQLQDCGYGYKGPPSHLFPATEQLRHSQPATVCGRACAL
jgi:hypothetical protein